MAKGGNHNQYSEDWFLSRGYTKNPDGSFQPPKFRNPLTQPNDVPIKIKSSKFNDGPSLIKNEFTLPVSKEMFEVSNQTFLSNNTSICKPLDSVLKIDGLIAGLNGDKGLMRSHWSNTKKQKDLYKLIIGDHLRENKVRKHEGKVTIQYIGYKSILMDWDNFCSSFKHIGDALVEKEIIKDDKPSIVTQFIPQQIKCKRDEQKVIIIIKDAV